jgi:hypothetical protein
LNPDVRKPELMYTDSEDSEEEIGVQGAKGCTIINVSD